MTEIEIRDLTKVYHVGDVDVHALRGVNLKKIGIGVDENQRTT